MSIPTDSIPADCTTGIARRSRFRAMAGPVPNHVVVVAGFRDVLLCTGGPAEAFTNGGGRDCPRCLALLAEQRTADD